VFVAPTLYDPGGGVSGRTTFAMVTWLIAWAVLHYRSRARQIESGRVYAATLVFDRSRRAWSLSTRLGTTLIPGGAA
jgi:multisubunit Na+/H+ antiporter MnhB subunit